MYTYYVSLINRDLNGPDRWHQDDSPADEQPTTCKYAMTFSTREAAQLVADQRNFCNSEYIAMVAAY